MPHNKLLADPSFEAVSKACPAGLMVIDSNNQIVFANDIALDIFGYEQAKFVGCSLNMLLPKDIRRRHRKFQQEFHQGKRSRPIGKSGILHGVKSNGETVPLDIGISSLTVDDEELALCMIIDRSEKLALDSLKLQNAQLERDATRDALTGLANRRLFLDLMSELLYLAERREEHLAIVFVDLDGFKLVNDHFGHHVGDELLIEVAQKIKDSVRRSDLVARFGGDEFVMCLNDAHSLEVIKETCYKVLNEIRSIHDVFGYPVEISASIGAVQLKIGSTVDVKRVIRKADELMYQVKKSGKSSVLVACI